MQQNKKFKKAKTKWTSAKKVTISRLKKGKTYYVKVIAYKKGKGAVKVFGKASKVKKVKIKKQDYVKFFSFRKSVEKLCVLWAQSFSVDLPEAKR